MNEKKMYRLLSDVTSLYADKKGNPVLYGKAKDLVTEIAVHDDVIIVERKDGFRYPVNINDLQEQH